MKCEWNILLVGKDKGIFEQAESITKGLRIGECGIKTFFAETEEKAKEILNSTQDFALIFIDVNPVNPDVTLDFVEYIRNDLNNNIVSIILHCTSYELKEKINLFEYDNVDYIEISELNEEKLLYLIISSIKYYRKSTSLAVDNEVLKTIVSIIGDGAKWNRIEDFVMSNYSTMKNTFNQMGISLDILVYLNNKFFKATPNFERYKTMDAETFLEKTFPDIDMKHNPNLFLWMNDSLLMILKHSTKPLVYVKFDRNLAESMKNILYLYFKELSTCVENGFLKNEINKALIQTVFTLGELVESRSEETGEHVERVSDYTEVLCRGLDLDEDSIYLYRIASVLHDIGKIGVPDKVLNKPGRLTPDEFEIMKQHTVIGYKILSKESDALLRIASDISLYHHESYNGGGYPYGIKGNETPLYARIVTLADYYDALSSDRVYRKAWKEKKILDSIKELRGKKFDPRVVDVFFDNYDKIIRARMMILHRRIGRTNSSSRLRRIFLRKPGE